MHKLLTTSSLCLALAFGSLAYAAPEPGHDGPPPLMMEKLSKLPQDKQDLIKKSFEEARASHKATHEQEKTLHTELRAIVEAPQFDKAAFIAKHKEIDALREKTHASDIERKADVLSKLSVDERKTFAEAMPHPKGPHGEHGKPGEKPGDKPASGGEDHPM